MILILKDEKLFVKRAIFFFHQKCEGILHSFFAEFEGICLLQVIPSDLEGNFSIFLRRSFFPWWYSRIFLLFPIPQDHCVPWCSSSPSSSMHMSSHLPTSKSPLVKGIFVPRGRDKKYHLLFFCVWDHP